MKRFRFVLPLITLSLAIVFNSIYSVPSQAQTMANPAFPPVKYKGRPEQPKTIGKEITLPDIPRFPGAKFIRVQDMTKQSRANAAYIIEYSIPKSSESQVMPFYANIFNASGWAIQQHTPQSIGAINNKTNTNCDITLSSENEFFSRLEINYSILPPSS